MVSEGLALKENITCVQRGEKNAATSMLDCDRLRDLSIAY